MIRDRIGRALRARLRGAEPIAGMLSDPPFTGRLDRAERDQRLRQALQELKVRRRPDALLLSLLMFLSTSAVAPLIYPFF